MGATPAEPEKVVSSPPNEAQNDDKKTGSHAGGMKSFVRIFTYGGPFDYALLSVALVASLAAGAAVALMNLVLGQFVTVLNNYVVGATPAARFRAETADMALRFVYIGAGRFACTYLYAALSTCAGHHVVRNLRAAYLRAALSQEVAFFDSGAAGSVSMQATSNGQLVQSGIAEKLGTFVAALGTFITAFVIAFATQWKLTLILMCIAPSLLLVIGFVAVVDGQVETEILGVQARGAAFAETILGSARNVHAFGLRARLMRRFDVYLDEARELGSKKNWLYGVMFSGEYTIIYLGIGLAFWQGLKMVTDGEVRDVGVVLTVMLSIIVATLAFTTVAPTSVAFSKAASAAAELFTLIDRVSEIDPFDDSGEKPTEIVGALQIDGVSFAYPTRPGVKVLEDFTLDIPAGKVTALVGASGSGKSTVIGLIERWYNPTSGTIKLDGRPIDALNLNWLRTNVRLVQQEPVLFNGTVFDNIAGGLVGTSLESAPPAEQRARVEAAARTAFAHDFISDLPDGYATRIGERGGLLSGGQKQRVAIARSIVSDPRILLLDEATSALDPHAEGIVQRALDNASRSRTTVVIAHRLATIRNADNIVVMAGGRIVEQGTHEDLVARGDGGVYARMVRAQTLIKAAAEVGEGEDDAVTSTSSVGDVEKTKEGPAAGAKATAMDGEEVAPTQSIVRYATGELQNMESLQRREDYDLHKPMGVVRTIWKLIVVTQDELKWWYLLLALDMILATSIIPGQIVLLSQTLDVFNTTNPTAAAERGNFLASMFIVLSAGAFVAYFILGWTTNTIAHTINKRMRHDMLDLFLRQDLRFFDREENTVGALTSRLDSQPEAALELMGFNIAIVVVSFSTVIVSSILAIVVAWKLGLVAFFAGIPPLMAAGYVRIRLESRMDAIANKRFSKSASIASEAILAIRTVSSLATERAVLNNYVRELDQAIAGLTPSLFGMFIFYAFTQAVEFFIMGLGFWYGARLMSFGEVTFYAFFVSFYGVYFAGQQAGLMFTYTSSFSKGLHAINYYFWLRGLEPTIRETDQNRAKAPQEQVSTIDLQGVRFSYPLRPDAQVLRGVSLEVLPGSFVALVGASGCGKSTVMALLERFYDPTRGSIRIDGADDLRTLNPRLYRRHVSLVQQEPTLYPGSIRENVAFGVDVADEEAEGGGASAAAAEHASDEEIEAALRAANAWDFVCSLPEGLGTACGTSGNQLSGGQRQRIAIARALVRQPRVLLLDEATSALDTESERVVQAALATAARSGGRITVAVAHRLSTVRDADLICVFYGGRIEEAGTHDELLAKGGMYAKMCEGQSLDRKV